MGSPAIAPAAASTQAAVATQSSMVGIPPVAWPGSIGGAHQPTATGSTAPVGMQLGPHGLTSYAGLSQSPDLGLAVTPNPSIAPGVASSLSPMVSHPGTPWPTLANTVLDPRQGSLPGLPAAASITPQSLTASPAGHLPGMLGGHFSQGVSSAPMGLVGGSGLRDGVLDDSLANLLMAWYWSGYYTGQYAARLGK